MTRKRSDDNARAWVRGRYFRAISIDENAPDDPELVASVLAALRSIRDTLEAARRDKAPGTPETAIIIPDMGAMVLRRAQYPGIIWHTDPDTVAVVTGVRQYDTRGGDGDASDDGDDGDNTDECAES